MAQHVLLSDIDVPAAGSGADLSDVEYIQAVYRTFVEGRPSMFRQQSTVLPEVALSTPELEALAAVGLVHNEGVATAADRARREAMLAFFHVLRDSKSTGDVAEMLGVNASRIRQRVRERSLLALQDGGELRIPMSQFVAGREVPGLRDVLQACPPDLRPIEFLSWFRTPTTELPGGADSAVSPRDYLLATGDVDSVVALARTLGDGEAA
jgi:hypothetical protein